MPKSFPYDDEVAQEILERISKGESVRSICAKDRDDFIPSHSTLFKWLDENEKFAEQYARACARRADFYFDQIIEIADAPNTTVNPETQQPELRDPARDRLRVDARKWVVSKLAPKKYGDKIEVEHSGAIDMDPDARVARIAELTAKLHATE